MTLDEARRTVDFLSDKATKLLTANGGHDPMAMMYTPKGVAIIGLKQIMNEAERCFSAGEVGAGYGVKGVMAKILKDTVKKNDAFGLVLITEVWMKRVPKKDLQQVGGDQPGMGHVVGPMPRFAPDREEALSVQWEFKLTDGTRYDGARYWLFWREKHGVAIGKPDESIGKAEGLLTGFIE